MTGRFEVFIDTAGEYRFRLKAANGEIIAASQGYTSREGVLTGIDAVRANAADAPIVDVDR